MDVVPADVLASFEFDQRLTIHADRLDLTGQTGKPLEFQGRIFDLNEPPGPFLLEQFDGHPRSLFDVLFDGFPLNRAVIV